MPELESEVCPFCQPQQRIVCENELAFAVFDAYPVNPGHLLVIPKRHVSNYFESSWEEKMAILRLLEQCKEILENRKPDGYNIGINCGEVAGQTVMHLHVHLIPRYFGDIDDPRGGIRGVIPSKRIY
ncbi:MAG: HIT family protein [Candidatus Odinarchaeota archaeon]